MLFLYVLCKSKGDENVCVYSMFIFIQKNPVEILARFSMESIHFQKAFCMVQQSKHSVTKGKIISLAFFFFVRNKLSVSVHLYITA